MISSNPIQLLVLSAVVNGIAAGPFLIIIMLISTTGKSWGVTSTGVSPTRWAGSSPSSCVWLARTGFGTPSSESRRSMADQPHQAQRPQDADAKDGRDESASERYDRNWGEILQEFRVTQTGTQIISGFLLTLAFQQRFAQLAGYQVAIYVILVILAATTTAVGLAPVSLHRVLFRHHEKQRIVAIGNVLLLINLVCVSLLTGGVALFILDVAVNLTVGGLAGAGMFLLLVCLLILLPQLAKRIRAGRENEPTQPFA
ncbi:MAG TPA: DUF6328 family protein [Galbitalea sp.]